MVPIQAGKVMTLMIVPIIDQYDIYELRDEKIRQRIPYCSCKRRQ